MGQRNTGDQRFPMGQKSSLRPSYLDKKWLRLQIVALEAEDPVLFGADVEGPIFNSKRGCCVW